MLGIEKFHFRHREDFGKQIVLVATQMVNQVPIVIAKHRPKHSRQLELGDLNPSIGQRISDNALPDCKLVQIHILHQYGLIKALISVKESLISFEANKIWRVNVDYCIRRLLTPATTLLLNTNVAFHPVLLKTPFK